MIKQIIAIGRKKKYNATFGFCQVLLMICRGAEGVGIVVIVRYMQVIVCKRFSVDFKIPFFRLKQMQVYIENQNQKLQTTKKSLICFLTCTNFSPFLCLSLLERVHNSPFNGLSHGIINPIDKAQTEGMGPIRTLRHMVLATSVRDAQSRAASMLLTAVCTPR